MLMAKASEADLDMAMDLSNALDQLIQWHGATVPQAVSKVKGEHEVEWLDLYNPEQCQRVLEHLLDLAKRASLMRVVWGMATLLDPANQIVDPDLDHLELHPVHRDAKPVPPFTGLTEAQQRDLLTAITRALGCWEHPPAWLVAWHDAMMGVPAPVVRPELEDVL